MLEVVFDLHSYLYQLGWDASDDGSCCITKIAQLPFRLLMLDYQRRLFLTSGHVRL